MVTRSVWSSGGCWVSLDSFGLILRRIEEIQSPSGECRSIFICFWSFLMMFIRWSDVFLHFRRAEVLQVLWEQSSSAQGQSSDFYFTLCFAFGEQNTQTWTRTRPGLGPPAVLLVLGLSVLSDPSAADEAVTRADPESSLCLSLMTGNHGNNIQVTSCLSLCLLHNRCELWNRKFISLTR